MKEGNSLDKGIFAKHYSQVCSRRYLRAMESDEEESRMRSTNSLHLFTDSGRFNSDNGRLISDSSWINSSTVERREWLGCDVKEETRYDVNLH